MITAQDWSPHSFTLVYVEDVAATYRVCTYCDRRDAKFNFPELSFVQGVPADEPCPMRNLDGCKILAPYYLNGGLSYGPGRGGCQLVKFHGGDHRLLNMSWRNSGTSRPINYSPLCPEMIGADPDVPAYEQRDLFGDRP